jgi:hypothetical protein
MVSYRGLYQRAFCGRFLFAQAGFFAVRCQLAVLHEGVTHSPPRADVLRRLQG